MPIAIQLHSRADSLTQAFILPRSVKWLPTSAEGWSPCTAMGWRVICRAASGAFSFRNCTRHSARGLSIVKRSRSDGVTMTPLYKLSWLNITYKRNSKQRKITMCLNVNSYIVNMLQDDKNYRKNNENEIYWFLFSQNEIYWFLFSLFPLYHPVCHLVAYLQCFFTGSYLNNSRLHSLTVINSSNDTYIDHVNSRSIKFITQIIDTNFIRPPT